MSRGNWSIISGDQEFWKKVGVATACLTTVLPTPIAMGWAVSDLEAEKERMEKKEPEAPLASLDDPSGMFSKGIGPLALLIGVGILFCFPTVLSGFAWLHVLTWFKSEVVEIRFVSAILNLTFLAVGTTLQAIFAATLPIALAQYARGRDLAPALAPLDNFLAVFQMGSDYWKKAAGVAFAPIAMLFITLKGFHFLLGTLLCAVCLGFGFISLILAGRHALAEVTYNM